MKSVLLAGALALVSLPAFANNYATNSPGAVQALGAGAPAASAGAAALSRATSVSGAHATGGRASASGGSVSVVNGGGGGGAGGYAAPFSPPGIATTNNCGGGISIGGFGFGGGGGGGALWELHDCRLRAAAVLLDARGDRAAAKGVWCQISEVQKAYSTTSEPCQSDERPVVVQVTNPAATSVVVHKYAVPDWCGTTSGPDPYSDRVECRRALSRAISHLNDR